MSTWAIGDIQGCWKTLQALLEQIGFNPVKDRLWLAGDLVNRGPGSLEVLRWARDLDERITAVADPHRAHGDVGDMHHGSQSSVLGRLAGLVVRGDGGTNFAGQVPVDSQLTAAVGVRDAEQFVFRLEDGDVLALHQVQYFCIVVGEAKFERRLADIV